MRFRLVLAKSHRRFAVFQISDSNWPAHHLLEVWFAQPDQSLNQQQVDGYSTRLG